MFTKMPFLKCALYLCEGQITAMCCLVQKNVRICGPKISVVEIII